MAFSIVGSNGQMMSPEESQLLALQAAYEAGRMSDEAYVGAASGLVNFIRPNNPATSRAASTLAALARRPSTSSGGILNFNMARNIPHTAPVAPGPVREVVQGLFDATPVAAGATRTIQFNASMIFKPTRLMLGPTMAPVFAIEDLRVSSDSLFLSPGRVPGEAFLPGAVGASALKRRSAQPGTPVSILVTNIDSVAHTFNAALYGESADFDGCAPA